MIQYIKNNLLPVLLGIVLTLGTVQLIKEVKDVIFWMQFKDYKK
jgi:hypothetical protein